MSSDLAAWLRTLPYTVEITRGGHLKITDGGKIVTFAAKTPTDRRTLENIKADVRRYERRKNDGPACGVPGDPGQRYPGG